MANKTTMYGWHALNSSKKLNNGDNRLVIPGKTLSVESSPILSHIGLHASYSFHHCLNYFNFSNFEGYLCRVKVWGGLKRGKNEFVGKHRKVCWMMPINDLRRIYISRYAQSLIIEIQYDGKTKLNQERIRRLINATAHFTSGYSLSETYDNYFEEALLNKVHLDSTCKDLNKYKIRNYKESGDALRSQSR